MRILKEAKLIHQNDWVDARRSGHERVAVVEKGKANLWKYFNIKIIK
jgi:hypothetical protein